MQELNCISSHPLELATRRLLQGVSSPPVQILVSTDNFHCIEEGNRIELFECKLESNGRNGRERDYFQFGCFIGKNWLNAGY
jgi:hypothetical protein